MSYLTVLGVLQTS